MSKINTVKTVYKGQPRGITKVAFADRWPLFRMSETTFRFSQEELRLVFVDRNHYSQVSLCTGLTVVPFQVILLKVKTEDCVRKRVRNVPFWYFDHV